MLQQCLTQTSAVTSRNKGSKNQIKYLTNTLIKAKSH